MRQIVKTPGLVLILLLILTACTTSKEELEIVSITVNNRNEANGVNPAKFFFSWKFKAPYRNVLQEYYQVQVSGDEKFSDETILWDSGKTKATQSILVHYNGQSLHPGSTYYFRGKVWDNHKNESEWVSSSFTTGLFVNKDWKGAKWIGMNQLKPENRLVPGIHLPGKEYRGKELGMHKLPLFRKHFEVKKSVKRATVFISGLGHYEMRLNGHKVGDHFLAPGWTDYDESAIYNTYDVTNMLKEGTNAVGMLLGNGFFIVPNERYRKVMTASGEPMMICSMKLEYKDGTTDWLVSDESWKTAPGPITFSSIYGGEDYNANLEQTGWDMPGFDDTTWNTSQEVTCPAKQLLPETDYPLKVMESISAKSITKIKEENSSYLYDFGQNASGVFEVALKGKKGDTVVFIPAELKTKDNRANQRATGRPHTYTYILKGADVERWQPRFTYYGFRYLQVEGVAPDSTNNTDLPQIVDLKMLHTRNSSPDAGDFSCSNPLFNDINTLIQWAIKSNLASVATDCPHREKLGWLEQAFLMGEGIHFNYDVYGLYSKMIDDMMEAQTVNGLVPNIVPEYTVFDFMDGVFRDSPEWGSAAIIVPWLLYKWYGDVEPIQRAWPMMERYLKYLESKGENHILDFGLGDWYDLGPERPGFPQLTPRSLTATAIYYYDVQLMSEMAALVNTENEVARLSKWAQDIKVAFNNEFYNPETGVYSTGSQTALSMPLVVGLVDDAEKDKVVNKLVESIEESGYALTAGDVGFNFLVKALQNNDQGEVLFKMNARDDVPGYGYQLKKGATALTESWQALEVVSNNHLMLGHLMEWFYAGVGGIKQTDQSVGYKELMIEPQVVGNINEAEVAYESPYGTIKTHWKNTKEYFTLDVEIPANTSAQVVFHTNELARIMESGNPVTPTAGFEFLEEKNGKIILKVGSGLYHFSMIK